MLNSDILEVVIGVALVYLLLSMLASTLMEAVAALLRLRSKDLEDGVRSMLAPPGEEGVSTAAEVFDNFYSHPLIRSLTRHANVPGWQKMGPFKRLSAWRGPSFIPPRLFATTLFDVVAPEDREAGSRTLAALRAGVAQLPDGDALRQLQALLSPATGARLLALSQRLPDGPVKRDLQQVLAAVGESTPDEATRARIEAEVEAIGDSLLQQEFRELLSPATLARVRALVNALPPGDAKDRLIALLQATTMVAVREGMEQLPNLDLKRSLEAVLREAGDDLAKARGEVERWFDQSMERVGGWYKRRAQWILVLIGLPIIAALNADTVTLATTFWQDDAVREVAVASASDFIQADGEAATDAYALRDRLSGLNTFGWRPSSTDYRDPREVPTTTGGWLWKFFGLGITMGAVSLGADFWFSALKKLLNLRSSGKEPERPAAAPAST